MSESDVPKTRTPQQIQAWEIYEGSVERATDAPTIVQLTTELGKVDKSQASFAFNRAKKAMEELGFFQDPKWVKKGFGPMGNKLRAEFLEVFKCTTPEMLPVLKSAFLNEDSHRLKSRKRTHVRLPLAVRDPPAAAAAAAAAVAAIAASSSLAPLGGEPKAKRSKKSSDKPSADREDGASDDTGGQASSTLATVAAAAPEVQAEAAKSIKAARLADAMQHASFALLTKTQQQAVRDDWLALLK